MNVIWKIKASIVISKCTAFILMNRITLCKLMGPMLWRRVMM